MNRKHNVYRSVKLPRVCVIFLEEERRLEDLNLGKIRYENGKYSLKIWSIGEESYFYRDSLSQWDVESLFLRIHGDSVHGEISISLLEKGLFKFNN